MGHTLVMKEEFYSYNLENQGREMKNIVRTTLNIVMMPFCTYIVEIWQAVQPNLLQFFWWHFAIFIQIKET